MATLDQETFNRLAWEVWPALEEGFRLPRGILHAIAHWETRGAYALNQVSPAGARGLFQITPIAEQQVLQQYGLGGDITNPYIASMVAAALLSRYAARFFGHVPLIVAAYNWGEGNVAKFIRAVRSGGAGWMPRETLDYIAAVREFMS